MKTFAAVLVYLLWVFNLIDYFTTDILLQHGYKEANPIMNWVIQTHGIHGLLAFKLAMLLILTEFLFELYEGNATRRAVIAFFIGIPTLTVLYAVVVANNMRLYIEVVMLYFT